MAKTKIHGEYLDPSVISGQTQVTAVGADSMLVFDATDNALKKALLSDLIETVGATPTFSQISATSNLTIDVAGTISLDADGAEVLFKDGGTHIGSIINNNSDFVFRSVVQDKDVLIRGNDGGSAITAVQFDMSDAGTATFNHDVNVTGQVNASTFVFEPTTATGLTYAADGTNSYINFEANSVADSGQLYFGQESSGGYIGIGLKHPSGSISQDVKIHHQSTLFSNRVGLNYPSELMFNGEYTIGQADITVEAGHAARIEFLKDDFFRIQGSPSVSAGAGASYSDKLKVNIDAGGIVFGSDTAAANTLNDYEEGTWTPSLGGNISASGQVYSVQDGTYTKIGRQVTCRFNMVLGTEGSFSNVYLLLQGFPFTIASSPSTVHMGNLYFTNLGANFISLGLQAHEGYSQAYIWGKTTASASRQYLGINDLANNTQLTGTFTYFV